MRKTLRQVLFSLLLTGYVVSGHAQNVPHRDTIEIVDLFEQILEYSSENKGSESYLDNEEFIQPEVEGIDATDEINLDDVSPADPGESDIDDLMGDEFDLGEIGEDIGDDIGLGDDDMMGLLGDDTGLGTTSTDPIDDIDWSEELENQGELDVELPGDESQDIGLPIEDLGDYDQSSLSENLSFDEFIVKDKFISFKSLKSGGLIEGFDFGGSKNLRDLFLEKAKTEVVDGETYLIIEPLVTFQNCVFEGDLKPFQFIHFTKGLALADCFSIQHASFKIKNIVAEKLNLTFTNNDGFVPDHALTISDCDIRDGLDINISQINNLEIIKTKVKNSFFIYHSGMELDMIISECEFWLDKKGAFGDVSQRDSLGLTLPLTDFIIDNFSSKDPIDELFLQNCKFVGEIDAYFTIDGNYGNLVVENNLFTSSLELNCNIEGELRVRKNKFLAHLFIGSLKFSEKYNVLPYREIKGHKLAILQRLGNQSIYRVYTASSEKELKDLDAFEDLIRVYQTLHNKYKEIGARVSSNNSYAEMKAIETRRWKQVYSEDRKFETLFRWQLNVFLAYFTDYGTNPAKAVLESFIWILGFALIYIFFPSQWDMSSRNMLIKRFGDLFSSREHREKSVLSNITYVLFISFIHILNAVTLSMNAFTTLGFGDIPAQGIARYMCIIEGFIGWFFLSIFSVSMINQVLG